MRSVGGAQRFLSAFSGISPHFQPRRHLMTAAEAAAPGRHRNFDHDVAVIGCGCNDHRGRSPALPEGSSHAWRAPPRAAALLGPSVVAVRQGAPGDFAGLALRQAQHAQGHLGQARSGLLAVEIGAGKPELHQRQQRPAQGGQRDGRIDRGEQRPVAMPRSRSRRARGAAPLSEGCGRGRCGAGSASGSGASRPSGR